ncbi:hypothetical protein FF1_027145 [Malus domestica]
MGEKRRRIVSLKIGRSSAGVRPPENQSGETCEEDDTCAARAARGQRVDPCHVWRVGARETYPEDDRIQGRHGGYDPSTYQ